VPDDARSLIVSTAHPERLRPGTVRAALRPTAAAMERMPAAVGTLAALAIVGYGRLRRPDLPPIGDLRLAMLALAAGAGFAFDDPAASTLVASPTDLIRRKALRFGLAVAAWSIGWVLVLVVMAATGGPLPVAELTVEAAGWLTASIAVAAAFGGAATGAALVGFAVAVHHLPASLSLRTAEDGWSSVQARWALVVIVSGVIAAGASLDPARSRRLRLALGRRR
jgi:hypothetical protein